MNLNYNTAPHKSPLHSAYLDRKSPQNPLSKSPATIRGFFTLLHTHAILANPYPTLVNLNPALVNPYSALVNLNPALVNLNSALVNLNSALVNLNSALVNLNLIIKSLVLFLAKGDKPATKAFSFF